MVGFPHSEILGSKLIRSSPRLIAAYYVLHRLHTPRHPLDALKTLDRSHYQCPQCHRPSPLLYGDDLDRRHGFPFRLPHRCANQNDQIKKPNLTSLFCFSPRVSGQTRQKAISLRCQNIRQWTAIAVNTAKLALSCTSRRKVYFWEMASMMRHTRTNLQEEEMVAPFRKEMVEPDGIEPTTSCLQSRRSPS